MTVNTGSKDSEYSRKQQMKQDETAESTGREKTT